METFILIASLALAVAAVVVVIAYFALGRVDRAKKLSDNELKPLLGVVLPKDEKDV